MKMETWTVDDFPDKIASQRHSDFIARIAVGPKWKGATMLDPTAFLNEGLPKGCCLKLPRGSKTSDVNRHVYDRPSDPRARNPGSGHTIRA
jgi:hypothetical protein